MANLEHLDILRQGVEVWKAWREEHPDIRPDLEAAHLEGANLRLTNLSAANLRYASLSDADLGVADLANADLSYANLEGAHLHATTLRHTNLHDAILEGANLSIAELRRTDLSDADLHGADLSHANIRGTYFQGTDLSHANLYGAHLAKAVFAYIDLSTVKGLEMVTHFGPSTIGIDTIYLSQGKIPQAFLIGTGVDDTLITYARSLVGKAIEYYSCFISYSSKDEAFAKRLYADLQSQNVRCWFAPEDLKWGNKIRSGIDEAIRLHDKLLLILSKSSVASGWVEREVKTALAKERKETRTVLFPVRVDKAVFESPFDWATDIRHERNIGDFTRWKNHDEYQKAFTRLLRDLQSTS